MFYRSNENFITWLYASRKLQPSILTDVGSNPRHRLCEDVKAHANEIAITRKIVSYFLNFQIQSSHKIYLLKRIDENLLGLFSVKLTQTTFIDCSVK